MNDEEDTKIVSCLVCDEDIAHACIDEAHARASEARARAVEGQWSLLVTGDPHKWQQLFLDGVPLKNGSGLELQVERTRRDDFGQYTEWEQQGSLVRYEMVETDDGRWIAMLYACVSGRVFEAAADTSMRFRWYRGP